MPYKNEIRGWMGTESLATIENWARHVPYGGTIVEIGSMLGRSSCCWAMTAPHATVYCIDPWNGESVGDYAELIVAQMPYRLDWFPRRGDINDLDTFKKNTADLPNIRIVQTDTSAGLIFDTDVVFIDASHRNPSDWEHILHWLPQIRPGGRLCGHDYESQFPDIVDNVYALEIMLNQKVVTCTEPGNTLWSFIL